MALSLYVDLLSQPSRALYILLKTCKIPFETKLVSLGKLEHLTPEYEKIHPFKKVPAIVHNDFKLIESVAITRYLAREFNVPEHWYPKDSKAQAKVDEFLEWQHLNTRLHCASYFLVKVMNPAIRGTPAKPEKVAAHERRVSQCLDLMEEVWLKNKDFVTGSEISVADLFGACEIEQVRMGGYDPRKDHPVLAAWMKRVEERTHPFYQEAHTVLNKIADKANKQKIASNL